VAGRFGEGENGKAHGMDHLVKLREHYEVTNMETANPEDIREFYEYVKSVLQ
jgi:hypothetical protein